MKIILNGDPFDIAGPLTIAELLKKLDIDARRVAVERNLVVLRRAMYDATAVNDGDQIEIVNFVGGGASGHAEPSRLRASRFGAQGTGACPP